jgi:tripartite-type tricarboxylate transporter receptor subunit TctC
MLKLVIAVICGALITAVAPQSQVAAQQYPERLVRIVVGFTPGGPADSVARSIAERLSKHWGQPVVVENMPGASGILGATAVIRSPADGYTLLLADSSSFVILPHLRAKLPFDPRTDFAPVTIVARQAPVLAARRNLPADSIPSLIAYAKANPGKVTFGSFGIGTWSHVKMEELAKATGTNMLHVPYRGAAQVVTDMLGDRVDLFLGAIGLFEAHVAAGNLKILATGTAKRLPFRPDIPTIAEAGLPDYSVSVWFGLVGPAGMPVAVADKIQHDVASVLSDPDYQQKFLSPQRLQGGHETPGQFKTIIATEFESWRRVIKDVGVTLAE